MNDEKSPGQLFSNKGVQNTGANFCAPGQITAEERRALGPLGGESEIRYGPVDMELGHKIDQASPFPEEVQYGPVPTSAEERGCAPGGCDHLPDELCQCTCHRGEDVMHFGPCCEQCPHCGRDIKIGFMPIHLTHCQPMQIGGHPVGQGDDDGPA